MRFRASPNTSSRPWEARLRSSRASPASEFDGPAVSRSVQIKADAEPGRVPGELEVAAQLGQLLYLCGEYGRLSDVLFAAAHGVTGLGEEAAFACA